MSLRQACRCGDAPGAQWSCAIRKRRTATEQKESRLVCADQGWQQGCANVSSHSTIRNALPRSRKRSWLPLIVTWDSRHTLEQALRRFNYGWEKFGVTQKALGVTAHGLRHDVLIAQFEALTGHRSANALRRQAASRHQRPGAPGSCELAGHARQWASNAYDGKQAKSMTDHSRPPSRFNHHPIAIQHRARISRGLPKALD